MTHTQVSSQGSLHLVALLLCSTLACGCTAMPPSHGVPPVRTSEPSPLLSGLVQGLGVIADKKASRSAGGAQSASASPSARPSARPSVDPTPCGGNSGRICYGQR